MHAAISLVSCQQLLLAKRSYPAILVESTGEEMHAHNKNTNNKYEMIKDESRQPECSANTRAQSE